MTTAVYPGSFDIVTFGHLDVIKRAAKLFDKLYVAVLNNPNKKTLFSAEERVKHLSDLTAELANVKAAAFEGLAVEFAESVGAAILIRGVRTAADFEYEFQMSQGNKSLNGGIETVLLPAEPGRAFLSSGLVKEAAMYGGDISGMAPKIIVSALKGKLVGEREAGV